MTAIDDLHQVLQDFIDLVDKVEDELAEARGPEEEDEVLGADGLPIEKGETVWDITSPNEASSKVAWRRGGPLKVVRQNEVRHGFTVCENVWGWYLDCPASDLTHTEPDTQERMDADAGNRASRYWKCFAVNCNDCPSLIDGKRPSEYYGVGGCDLAKTLDLMRRQREFDARVKDGE